MAVAVLKVMADLGGGREKLAVHRSVASSMPRRTAVENKTLCLLAGSERCLCGRRNECKICEWRVCCLVPFQSRRLYPVVHVLFILYCVSSAVITSLVFLEGNLDPSGFDSKGGR